MGKLILVLSVVFFSLLMFAGHAHGATRPHMVRVQTTRCMANDTGHSACITTTWWVPRARIAHRVHRTHNTNTHTHAHRRIITLTNRDIALLDTDMLDSIRGMM